MLKKILTYAILGCIVCSLSSCDALLKTVVATKQKESETLNAARAGSLNLPPNADRIPMFYLNNKTFNPTVNAFGVRYKDFVFQDLDITTDVYSKNVNDYNGKSTNLVIDIIQPKNDVEQNRPCVIFVFGGGFTAKMDDCQMEFAKGLAMKGYVVAMIDYRIGFKNGLLIGTCNGDFSGIEEAALRGVQDAKTSIRYLKINAQKLKIDPNKIIIGGHSAGAFVALECAFRDAKEEKTGEMSKYVSKLGSLETFGGYTNVDTRVAAVFSLAGGIFDKSILNNNVPTYLLMGSCDELLGLETFKAFHCNSNTTIPDAYGAKTIYSIIKDMNKNNRFDLVCNGGHGPAGWGAPKIVDRVANWLYALMNNIPAGGQEVIYPEVPVCTANQCQF